MEELPDEELLALEQRWFEGKLLERIDRLMLFVENHRNEILSHAAAHRDVGALTEAVKTLILHKGSVHMPSELRDQMREIQAELWYRGERGETDHSRIKQEWTDRHASNWRRWRIKEYLFVADHCAAEIAERLLGDRGYPSDSR